MRRIFYIIAIFVFLPVFLVFYYISPQQYRNGLLFIGSLIFYGVGEPLYLFLILLSVIVNFLIGQRIGKLNSEDTAEQSSSRKKCLLIIALLYNLGLLLFFKYTNFFIENINALSGMNIRLLNIALPLGISFYTFQIVSYIIDVYHGRVPAEDSIVNLGAYLCMFPQLIAGPIVIYSDIMDALKEKSLSVYNLDSGFKTFILGLGYKVILANRIGTLWTDICTIGFESISTPLAWLGALSYSMQLYFDFNGYSLMAMGLGQMLGFNIPVNFRHPYMARSVTDFWRRWHITLGTWFREYVYIPLGGNRRGKLCTMRNLLIVWFLVGFWHGAAWNFIIWGLLIFVLQIIEKNFLLPFLSKDSIVSKCISHAYMIIYILVSWTVFAISDFGQLGIYLARMFPFFKVGSTLNPQDIVKYITEYAPLLIMCIIFSTDYPEKLLNKVKDKLLGIGIALCIFWYSVYFLSIGRNNPFLYFRF